MDRMLVRFREAAALPVDGGGVGAEGIEFEKMVAGMYDSMWARCAGGAERVADAHALFKALAFLTKMLRLEPVVMRQAAFPESEFPFFGKVVMKDSSVHGKGLFAECDMPGEGHVVTVYPADLVFFHRNLVPPKMRPSDPQMRWAVQDMVFEDPLALVRGSRGSHEFPVGPMLRICPAPGRGDSKFQGTLLGQYVNDAVGNTFTGVDTATDVRNGIYRYESQRGTAAANCRVVVSPTALVVYVVTCKPVREGEELVALYGAEYWHSLMAKRAPVELARGVLKQAWADARAALAKVNK